MKIISIILALCCITPFFGQEISHQKTKNGKKTGKWFEYNENGSIREVRCRETEYVLIGSFEAVVFKGFIGQVDTVRNADTLYYGEKLLWTEEYQYASNNELRRIIKSQFGEQDPIFLYGPNKEIAIRKDEFSFSNRVSTIEVVTMAIHNVSESLVKLTVAFESENFSTDQYRLFLPPQKDTSFTFQLSIQPNVNHYTVTLKNDSISVGISVKTFGYNIESNDVAPENQLTVKNGFVYWRSGDEALLRLYDKEQQSILRTFSLAHETFTFDLKGIKPGDYMLCKRSFSTPQQSCCKLKVEK